LLSNGNLLRQQRIKSGVKDIDSLVEVGILTGQVTEICGLSGTGKSQFALQLAMRVQLPAKHGGLGKGTVF
jgi:DNA repair protein RAD57